MYIETRTIYDSLLLLKIVIHFLQIYLTNAIKFHSSHFNNLLLQSLFVLIDSSMSCFPLQVLEQYIFNIRIDSWEISRDTYSVREL